jgi:uncharacterized protein YndB with AHSA1/START domain
LITIVMSASIRAEPARVWRAISDATEIIAWDGSRIAAIDDPTGYPVSGREFRWRYRLGGIPSVLNETPREVVEGWRLESRLSTGSLGLEQTFTLQSAADGTRLAMKLVAANSVTVIGAVVDRFEMRRMASDRVNATLRSLQDWCEAPAPKPRRRRPGSASIAT